MDRQLTIEKRGELYHVEFHRYMGPWEGHEIERRLRLEEVEPPPDGESYQRVLGPNQAYLWHEMDRDAALHALVTEDRLKPLAEIVRYKDVRVLAGEEFLPQMPPVEHTDEESYIAYIEKMHEPVWHKGPGAILGATLLRVIPVVILVFVVIIAGRHMGDKREAVDIDELFARAEQPLPDQDFLAGLWSPDYSHLVRHEIRTVRYCSDNRMILGDGSFVVIDGMDDAMPLLRAAQMKSAALVLDATVHGGQVVIDQITCSGEVLAQNKRFRRIAQLGASDSQPPRSGADNPAVFLPVGEPPWMADADDALEVHLDDRISLEGTINEEDGRRVLRTSGGIGLVLDADGVNQKLRQFLEVFTEDPGQVKIDVVLREVYPWTDRSDPSHQRKGTRIIGVGEVYSASAQNHHVVGRG